MSAGLFGRQEGIAELEIPKWATLYCDMELYSREMLFKIIGSLSTIGLLGCIVIFPLAQIEQIKWFSIIIGDLGIDKRRPYFKVILANEYIEKSQIAGPIFSIIQSRGIEPNERGEFWKKKIVFPDIIKNEEMFGIDMALALLFRASQGKAAKMVNHINSLYTNELPWFQDQWKTPFGANLLKEITSILAMNMFIKPSKYPPGRFFYTNDFTDETISDIINERKIRIINKANQ
jgi:hypothetical protein